MTLALQELQWLGEPQDRDWHDQHLKVMGTLVSMKPATTRSKTTGKRPGLKKLFHWSVREKVMGSSDHLRGIGVTGSMDIMSRRIKFCARLVGRPPKMTLTVLSGCW
jgi:hypothetical protein